MDDDNTGTLNLKETTELIVGLNLRRKDTRSNMCTRCCSFKEREVQNYRFRNMARKFLNDYGDWDANDHKVIYKTVFLENAKKGDGIVGRTISQKRALIIFSHKGRLFRHIRNCDSDHFCFAFSAERASLNSLIADHLEKSPFCIMTIQ